MAGIPAELREGGAQAFPARRRGSPGTGLASRSSRKSSVLYGGTMAAWTRVTPVEVEGGAALPAGEG